MSRISVFSAPFLLGFDSFEERVDRLTKSADGYPPYNIERTTDAEGTERFLISIAVAGFGVSELDVLAEDNQIVVRGKQKDEPDGTSCIAALPHGSSSALFFWPMA